MKIRSVKAMIRAYDMSNPSDPPFLGYLTPVPIVNSGLFSYTQDPTDAVVVTAQITGLQPGNIEFEVSLTDFFPVTVDRSTVDDRARDKSPPFNGYPNLGFSCAADYSELRPGLSNICYLVGSTAGEYLLQRRVETQFADRSHAVPMHSPPVFTPDQSFTNSSASEPTESAVW